jgi:hypothetical protein
LVALHQPTVLRGYLNEEVGGFNHWVVVSRASHLMLQPASWKRHSGGIRNGRIQELDSSKCSRYANNLKPYSSTFRGKAEMGRTLQETEFRLAGRSVS